MVRVADYIAQKLSDFGIRDVFLVTGGGSMHLNDAFGKSKTIKYTALHHEQSCAMAAESYARISQKVAAVNVTTGPGGTNTITGIFGAFVDSVPVFVVSGQVKWETLVRNTDLNLRQLGDQEIDIISIVKPITKYSEIIQDSGSIRYHLEKAWYLATHGRPGPVWLDIPMNIQGELIDETQLVGFDPDFDLTKPFGSPGDSFDKAKLELQNIKSLLKGEALLIQCHELITKLKSAKRPVIMVGAGVRLSGMHSVFLSLIESLQIPVTTCWNAHDSLWHDHPLFVGKPGIIGDRAGNFAVQNSDFLLVLGSRLNIRQVSYAWELFAREAFKVMVDIDQAEMNKPTLKIDLKIHADLKNFIPILLEASNSFKISQNSECGNSSDHLTYLNWCKARLEKYPPCLPEYWNTQNAVNPYCFTDELFRQLVPNDQIVTGDGTACVVTFQAARLKPGQRLFTNSGCASMGYDLPGAIGAAIATKKRVICLAGDGSIQMNIQELQTIVSKKLPIKIFIFNNQGYHSIRQTQHSYFSDNIVGCGTESGLSFPSFERLSFAYDLPYSKISTQPELKSKISEVLKNDKPEICEILLDLNQQFAPKLSSRKLPDGRMVSLPLEDLAPFLSREELRSNMLIQLAHESVK